MGWPKPSARAKGDERVAGLGQWEGREVLEPGR